MRLAASLALTLSAAMVHPLAAEEIGDAALGAELFKQECSACHQIGEGAANRVGPRLNGLFGRRAGSIADFDYSRSMARMGSDGLAWTFETLDPYVENPEARSALLAFIREWSDKPRDIPEAEPTARGTDHEIDPAILAIKGDPAYGEYLSSECITCHQSDGSDQGIPSITGWPAEDFAAAMHAYKEKLRPHPVMQMMAGRLSNDEIAALAAYFTTLQ
jgi:cytochrome c